MKESIIGLLRSHGQKPTTIQQIKDALRINDKDSFTQMMKTINLLEEETVIVPVKEDSFCLLEYSECMIGTLRINKKGFGFVDGENESVYINERNLHSAMDQDEVLVQVKTTPYGDKEGIILRVLSNRLSAIVGNIRFRNGKPVFYPDKENLKQHIRITNLKDFTLVDGHKVVLSIQSYGSTLTCRIDRILGHVNDPGVDIEGILTEHSIPLDFPEEVLEEANTIDPKITLEEYKKRTDLTKRTIITIDGDDAKDLDDAISIAKTGHKYRLGVHIADVSYYVREGQPLDREAYNRSTSVYVTDRVVPMLPHALCNGICSLNPHEPRLTITCEMDIETDGTVSNYQIYPSIIRSRERMTYRNVNRILDGEEEVIRKYQHIYSDLLLMADCSERIRKHRFENGAMDFDREESEIVLNEKGKVVDIKPRERFFAERMIEDFMVCANETVARHMKWMEYPCLYRIHEQPPVKKMREFVRVATIMGYPWKGNIQEVYPKQLQNMLEEAKDTEAFPVISSWMLRSMSKAKYDPNCIGHFGLGLQEYLHFTSPIRRYPDLIVHRMLRKYFFGQCLDLDAMKEDLLKMEDYARQTSSRERDAVECERDVDDMKKAEYMESHIGQVFSGIISGITNFGLFVTLPNTVEGLAHVNDMTDDYYKFSSESFMMIGERTGRKFRIGQTVQVKCIGASRYTKSVDFVILHKEERQHDKTHRRKPKSKA